MDNVQKEIVGILSNIGNKEVKNMNEHELEERLDFIEFRQELLFTNTQFDRLMFNYKVTRDQHKALMDLFVEYREVIDNGGSLDSSRYETTIGEIVPHHNHDYHFAEDIAKILHEEGKFQEVFEALYGDSPKFQSYFESYKNQYK